ncbi:MAG TPA: hypothetical protein PK367_01460, partial [Candidatus Paceibacterota bacterium]|nr:hypothetical protein [Candidatus Paceibacterota bacterium]
MKLSLFKKYLFISFLIFPTIVYGQSFPAFPMSFFGEIKINDSLAPPQTIVRAYYGSVLAGQVTIDQSGIYGYNNPTQKKLIVSEGSGEIRFTIQNQQINSNVETAGTNSQTYAEFTSGWSVNKNLLSVVSSSARGGGGG